MNEKKSSSLVCRVGIDVFYARTLYTWIEIDWWLIFKYLFQLANHMISFRGIDKNQLTGKKANRKKKQKCFKTITSRDANNSKLTKFWRLPWENGATTLLSFAIDSSECALRRNEKRWSILSLRAIFAWFDENQHSTTTLSHCS